VRKNSAKNKAAGRAARTLRSLVYITALGVILAVYNAVSLHRDVGLAIGPKGPAQEQFFRDASDRPDIATFFKNMTPARRLIMAKNIGRYTDPELAALCGKCLDTFDAEARLALTESLAVVAKAHPDAAAALLKLPGSFQQIAIAAALRKAGDKVLPLVAKQFSDGDARPNAIAYLVASGRPAVAATMPYLASNNKDIRLAAADALGKLRATEAVVTLTRMFHASKEDERLAYLTALATIGDPVSEQLMTDTIKDQTLPTPHRAQAALGLGTIATETSLTMLWTYAADIDKSLREAAISALQIAGDPALRIGLRLASQHDTLEVAAGVRTPLGDSVIAKALENPATVILAAQVAGGRPDLVQILTGRVQRLDPNTEGDQLDSIFRALGTTAQGRTALTAICSATNHPALAALASRRVSLLR
jgi:hypothetical protein